MCWRPVAVLRRVCACALHFMLKRVHRRGQRASLARARAEKQHLPAPAQKLRATREGAQQAPALRLYGRSPTQLVTHGLTTSCAGASGRPLAGRSQQLGGLCRRPAACPRSLALRTAAQVYRLCQHVGLASHLLATHRSWVDSMLQVYQSCGGVQRRIGEQAPARAVRRASSRRMRLVVCGRACPSSPARAHVSTLERTCTRAAPARMLGRCMRSPGCCAHEFAHTCTCIQAHTRTHACAERCAHTHTHAHNSTCARVLSSRPWR